MKKILNVVLFSAILASVTLSVSSCKKDDTTTPTNNNSNASSGDLAPGKSKVKATVSGAYSTNYESTDLASTATSSGGVLLITSSNISTSGSLNVDQYIITLPSDITTGSYKATDFSSRGGGIFTYARSEGGSVAGGWQADPEGETDFSFTITKATGSEIEGTFDGEMSNDNDATKIKTVGSFAAKY